ncbi:MAG: hypothetical protein AAF236_17885, partial [Verrucomicrobiota bacterium]
IADAGHFGAGNAFAGRRQTGTQQGIYIATASGELLGSGNQQDADFTAELMRSSLRDSPSPRRDRSTLPASAADRSAIEDSGKADPPVDGLVLDVVLRQIYPRKLKTAPGTADLYLDEEVELSPMESMVIERMRRFASQKSEDYWHVPWNRDRAWFTKHEQTGWIPDDPAIGRVFDVSPSAVDRIARFHCTDTIRAIAAHYPKDALSGANLRGEVVKSEDGVITLVYEGAFTLQQEDIPLIGGNEDRSAPVPKRASRSYRPKLLGRARFDLRSEKFIDFEMIALGQKTGGSLMSAFDETQFAVALRLVRDPDEARSQAPRYLALY